MRQEEVIFLYMKKTIFAILAMIMFTSSCFAYGILSTGTTVGQDNWAVQAQYSSTGLTQMNVNGSLAGLGAKATYGLMKDLDVYADYWTGSYVVSDFDFSEAGSAIGVGLKYALMKTADNDPLDVAGFIDLSSLTAKDLTWGTNSLGVTASKMIKPQWTVYGVVAVLLNDWKVKGTKDVSETDTDMGVGVKYDVNKKFAVLGEIDRTWLDTNLYQTISIAGEWAL